METLLKVKFVFTWKQVKSHYPRTGLIELDLARSKLPHSHLLAPSWSVANEKRLSSICLVSTTINRPWSLHLLFHRKHSQKWHKLQLKYYSRLKSTFEFLLKHKNAPEINWPSVQCFIFFHFILLVKFCWWSGRKIKIHGQCYLNCFWIKSECEREGNNKFEFAFLVF